MPALLKAWLPYPAAADELDCTLVSICILVYPKTPPNHSLCEARHKLSSLGADGASVNITQPPNSLSPAASGLSKESAASAASAARQWPASLYQPIAQMMPLHAASHTLQQAQPKVRQHAPAAMSSPIQPAANRCTRNKITCYVTVVLHRRLLVVEAMAVAGVELPLLLTAAIVNAYSTPGCS